MKWRDEARSVEVKGPEMVELARLQEGLSGIVVLVLRL
jgi:hypothetical protein